MMCIKNLGISIVICLSFVIFSLHAQVEISLTEFANGLSRPVSMAHAGDERLFVVEKRGTIRIIQNTGDINPGFFLDIRGKVDDTRSEKGLLGLAFHPQYAENGHFYVNYTNLSETIIARFSVDPNDPDRALDDSEVILITQPQPFDNHNAGDIHFGPDGYLYIGLGDGGSAGDPGNRAQDPLTWLGKMLRIDVDGGTPYLVPPDNPYADVDGYLPEIWAIGLRNPWRFSFDRATGEMYIADVGQNQWEEIHVQPAESSGGENYGWRCYEGFEEYNFAGCEVSTEFTEPAWAYAHSFQNGCSITGGYVYRGVNEEFQGKYIYTDFCSGQFWMLYRDGEENWVNAPVGKFQENEYAAFGQDVDGDLYVASLFEGHIYRLELPVASSIAKEGYQPAFVFPNPASNELVIELDKAGPARLEVYDAKGYPMHFADPSQDNNRILMDISAFPDGIYLVRIIQEETRYSCRVVKAAE